MHLDTHPCQPPLLIGLRIDQIPQRLNLCQVHSTRLERSPREFATFGRPASWYV